MRRGLLPLSLVLLAAACGGQTYAPARTGTVRHALTSAPELTESEPLATRQELFRALARTSQAEAGQRAENLVLFPVARDGNLVAAPGFDERADLFLAQDAGEPLTLSFDGRNDLRWPEDRREALQGLSEREAVELVVRTLLAHWQISPGSTVRVDRAPGAPYAVAYLDGILRVNPSFLYLATAAVAPVAE